MVVVAKSSHPNIFFAEHETITVPPRSKCNNWVVYRASSL
jgi:hypothetical protein